jgi:copper resistance protein B
MRGRRRSGRLAFGLAAAMLGTMAPAYPQSADGAAQMAMPFGDPMGSPQLFSHAMLDQFEERFGAGHDELRWDGEAWAGSDSNRLWFKSEGFAGGGQLTDGQHELLYARPASPFFDLQAGVRYDLDSLAGRGWLALGIEGLAAYNLKVSASVYASDAGHFAAKATAAYDALVTQRLILQPQIELNAYTRGDSARQQAAGVSAIDAGLRLRYEISRKFAPYLGAAYSRNAFLTGSDARQLRWMLGLRAWF